MRRDHTDVHGIGNRRGFFSHEWGDALRYIYCHAELFRLRLLPLLPQLDRDDLRLTLEQEEDWDHARPIVEAIGPERLDWQAIAGLLREQPAMRERMAVLNRVELEGSWNG